MPLKNKILFSALLNGINAVVIFSLIVHESTGNSLNEAGESEVDCIHGFGISLGSRERERQCCNKTVEMFEQQWSAGELPLTEHLAKLEAWRCWQLEEECRERTFAYNTFTTLVYDYFCNKTLLVEKCVTQDTISAAKENAQFSFADESDRAAIRLDESESSASETKLLAKWSSTLLSRRSDQYSHHVFQDPCLQIAMYDASKTTRGSFHEITNVDVPSCTLVWCGYSDEFLKNKFLSTWACMLQSCRVGVMAITATCALLAALIVFVNASVMAVILRNWQHLHSQAVYKFSLALADIMVGLVVCPTFISTLLIKTSSQHRHKESFAREAAVYQEINGTRSNETVVVSLKGSKGSFLSEEYLNFVGFFTTFSFLVSIYTLIFAGFDRVAAVHRPLRYRQSEAKTLAKKCCLGLWIAAAILASLPWYVPSLSYRLIVSFLVSWGGRDALIVYAVALALPLVAMWVTGIATFCLTREHARASKHLCSRGANKARRMENRLARTLSLMVGVFTLSVLPALVVSVCLFFVSNVHYSLPRQLDVVAAGMFRNAEFSSVLILSCNSLWNFFIYNGRNVEFRKAVKQLYSDIAASTGLSTCWSPVRFCIRTVAQNAKDQSLARSESIIRSPTTERKDISSKLTSTTKSNSSQSSASKVNSESNEQPSIADLERSLQVETAKDSAMSNTGATLTELESETITWNPTKKSCKYSKSKKRSGEIDVTDDSIFRSFAIDVNVDNFTPSVLQHITP